MKAHRLVSASAFALVAALVVWPAALSACSGRSAMDLPTTSPATVEIGMLSVERQTQLSQIIVVGQVVRVDPPRWNGPHGKPPSRFSCASWDPIVYATFYVEPSQELKGEPKWGTPVAFRVTGVVTKSETTDAFVATMPSIEDLRLSLSIGVGDSVVVFGEVVEGMYGGGVYEPVDAYWLTMGDSSVWAEGNGKFLNKGRLMNASEGRLSLATLVSKISGYVEEQK